MNTRLFLGGIKRIITRQTTHAILKKYYRRFVKHSFVDCKCDSPIQFESSIIRLYHTIEKGLAYEDYRAGFGKENVRNLIISLEQYSSRGYDLTAFFYETALSCLNEYVKKNKEYGFEDLSLEKRISSLPGKANRCGGTIGVSTPVSPEKLNYEELIKSRHSIRHFSKKSVDINELKEAIKLAQFTPSACNRQGWKTRIIEDKNIIRNILNNQNGNRGFGQEIDKLLVVTADLRAQQKNREIFEAFIDGGMYTENLLNCLFFKGIGSVPLSAALVPKQDSNVRGIIDIDEGEVLIAFIGVGYYPEGECLTTRSERKNIDVEVI